MNLAKATGAATTAVTGTKAAGSIVKSLISNSNSTETTSAASSTSSSSKQVKESRSEDILRLMYSNQPNAQKLVSEATQDIVAWYKRANQVSQAEAMGYQGKIQAASMIGGAFSAAGQGLSQMVAGKKKGGGDGEEGGGGGRRSSGEAGGGGGCPGGNCNIAQASTDAWKGAEASQATQMAQNAMQQNSQMNPSQEMASLEKSQMDLNQTQQIQPVETPPPPPPTENIA